MKKLLLKITLILCVCLLGINEIYSQQLAFPGAEGFGRYALGARGVSNPEVYHVTNLNDSGKGSLRDAISQPGRIVVFDVSGVINIKSRLVFSANSYIAGQTAPGDGIVIYGNGSSFSGANNLIIRHLRIYMGKSGDKGKDTSGIANGKDMMIDHMSLTWCLDEVFSINWDNKGTKPENITIQNSIIGQALKPHPGGGLIQSNVGVSIIGCLYINNKTRNPRGRDLIQYVNNVVYNWGGTNGFILGGTTGSSWVQMEGNYFLAGPHSGSSPFCRGTSQFQLYQRDNYMDMNKNGVLDGRLIEKSDFGTVGYKNSPDDFVSIPKVHPEISSGILSPQDALNKVIASVGASLPARSHVDDFLINELVSYGKEGTSVPHERDLGLPNIIGVVSTGAKALDTDGDGIPDWWEDENGLDKSDKSDAVKPAANGYLNIENYINSIEGPVAPYLRCVSEMTYVNRTLSSIEFSWKNNTTDADQILIQIAKDGEAFEDFATISGTATSYIANGLDKDTYYNFRFITKKSGMEDSTPSGTFRETTMGDPLPPDLSINPTPAIGGTSRFYNSIDFSWSNLTRPWGGKITYDVYFGSSSDALVKVGENIADTTFTYNEGNMAMKENYYWRVDATNNEGSTQGTVWNCVTSTYSFIPSFVDIGRDFNGTTSSNAKSGTLITSTSSYTIDGEMTIKASNSAMMNTSSSNGVYQESGNYTFFYINAAGRYIQGTLTEGSADKVISSIKVNGTSADLADGAVCNILYSDAPNFDENSIIGYEEFELAPCRSGNEGIVLQVSETHESVKSFRIYTNVTISMIGEDIYKIGSSSNAENLTGSGSPRIAYIGVNLQLISQNDPDHKESVNTIKTLTINGKDADANQEERTFTYEFLKGTVLGEWPVTFVLGSNLATTDFESGSTHNFANGPLNIKVTAQDGTEAIYTVTATVSDKITIGMLTSTGAASSYDNLLLSAFDGYNVKFIEALTTAPANINTFYKDYDLLVLHSNVDGKNVTGVATSAMVGVKPILNLKAFFYTSGRWNWSTPNNTEIGRVNSSVDNALQNHPIFETVTFDNDKLVLFSEATTVVNAFQYVTAPLSGSSWTSQMNTANNTLATIDGNATKVHIHELNLNNSAKYLLIGLSNEGDSYTRFNTNAVTMIKNAVEYLLDPNVYYDYSTNTTVGIQNNVVNDSKIFYTNGFIYNPDMEYITVFNSMGTAILTSKENLVNVQNIPTGLYIVRTKTKTTKFIR